VCIVIRYSKQTLAANEERFSHEGIKRTLDFYKVYISEITQLVIISSLLVRYKNRICNKRALRSNSRLNRYIQEHRTSCLNAVLLNCP
jgi:hypothetical protein